MRFARLQEAAAQVTDAVEPAGGVALRPDRRHDDDYFFLPFALLLALAPFDFADFSAAAQSSP